MQLIPDGEALLEMCLPSLKVHELWANNWWDNEKLDYKKIESILNGQLPRIEWSSKFDDLKEFGNSETNDISISLDSNKITSVHVRIDLRNLDLNFVNLVLKIATELQCMLFDTDGQIYSPNKELLFEKLRKSRAFKFVDNPEKFLSDLSRNI